MKLSERIAQLKKQRGDKVTAMEAIHAKAMEEGRSFDETEQSAFDDLKSDVASVDKQLENCLEMEKLMIKTADPIVVENGAAGGESSVDVGAARRIQVVRNLPKGAAFTRYAMSLAAAQGNRMEAAEIAKSRWGRDTPEVEAVLRAAVAAGTTTDTTWARPLAQYTDMASEFIELLRPETILGQVTGWKSVPFNVRMPRQTAGATAGWVGEGAPKPVSALAFDSFTIPHTKIAVIVAITEELARFSTPSAEATVRQDLVATIAQFIDRQMFDPTVAAVSDVSPGALTNGLVLGTNMINSTGSTVALVTADLNTAMTAMATASINMRNPYWVMHPRTKNYLMTLRTTQDVYAFRDELVQGRLLGVPVVASANVPLRDQSSPASAGSLEGYIALIEASEIFVADDGEVMIDVSREASLQMDGAPSASAAAMFSLWQNNMVGIRAERYIYWAARRSAAVFLIKNVSY